MTHDHRAAAKEWRKARANAGHSQQQAAETIGVPLRTYQGWERGQGSAYRGLLDIYMIRTGWPDPQK